MNSFHQAHNEHLDPDIHNVEMDSIETTGDGVDVRMAILLDNTFDRKDLAGWKKSTYKGTDCGAWFKLISPLSIEMGSIVEGADECAETQTLTYPFSSQDVWNALEAIEKDCERIWMETHGCDDCFPDTEESLTVPVRLDCKTCKGKGVVI